MAELAIAVADFNPTPHLSIGWQILAQGIGYNFLLSSKQPQKNLLMG